MSDISVLKEVINKSKNRNTRFVRVKSDRSCQYCRNKIRVGDESLTTNKKSEGRRWICLDCLNVVLRCARTKAKLDSVVFGDDGYYMALSEVFDKDKAKLYVRGILN